MSRRLDAALIRRSSMEYCESAMYGPSSSAQVTVAAPDRDDGAVDDRRPVTGGRPELAEQDAAEDERQLTDRDEHVGGGGEGPLDVDDHPVDGADDAGEQEGDAGGAEELPRLAGCARQPAAGREGTQRPPPAEDLGGQRSGDERSAHARGDGADETADEEHQPAT